MISRPPGRPLKPVHRIRLAGARAPVPVAIVADDAEISLNRIAALAAQARANWLAMLAYLVFFGITLLGVQDIDLFVARLQTRLPLVDVSIPTLAFFQWGAALAMAMHIYLHLHLLKLWDALARAPETVGGQPLGSKTFPSLIVDFALRLRGDAAARAISGPMNVLSSLAILALVWLAAPGLLAFAWWRSMPAHMPELTAQLGAMLLLSSYATLDSLRRLAVRVRPRDERAPRRRAIRRAAGIVTALAVCVAVAAVAGLSWTRTLGGEVIRPEDAATDRGALARLLALAPIDLRETELVPVPDDWRDWDAGRNAFRAVWCARSDVPAQTCGPSPRSGLLPAPSQINLRTRWCWEKLIAAEACAGHFASLDRDFLAEWRDVERLGQRVALTPLDMRGRDLRGADLRGAFLVGADLRGTALSGANLTGARLEGARLDGADLRGAGLGYSRMQAASLQGADLAGAQISWARLEEADLRSVASRLEGADAAPGLAPASRITGHGAQLEGALLDGADLRGADLLAARLIDARMEGTLLQDANLQVARLDGARLGNARRERVELDRADLTGATLFGATVENASFAGAVLDNAAIRNTDLTRADGLSAEQLALAFWDGSVTLPPPFVPWTDWRAAPLTDAAFRSRWRGWLERPEGGDLLIAVHHGLEAPATGPGAALSLYERAVPAR